MCSYYFPRTLVGIFQASVHSQNSTQTRSCRENAGVMPSSVKAQSRAEQQRVEKGCQQSIGALTIASLAAAQAEALFCL